MSIITSGAARRARVGITPRRPIRPGRVGRARPRRPGIGAYARGIAEGAVRSIPGIGGAIGGALDVRGRPMMGYGRRRGRGISAANLKGFNKVLNLLKRVGMVPKKIHLHVRRAKR